MNPHAYLSRMKGVAGAAAESATDAPLAIEWWTGSTIESSWPTANTVRIVGVCGSADRDTARRVIREALSAALADVTAFSIAEIFVHGTVGKAPHALLGAAPASRRVELAISHDGAVSAAAFRLHGGPVGIDVMQVTALRDREVVA